MKGWVGLVGWPIVDGLPHKWSPLSYRSSAGQGKFAGQSPTFYRCTTQPVIIMCYAWFLQQNSRCSVVSCWMEHGCRHLPKVQHFQPCIANTSTFCHLLRPGPSLSQTRLHFSVSGHRSRLCPFVLQLLDRQSRAKLCVCWRTLSRFVYTDFVSLLFFLWY